MAPAEPLPAFALADASRRQARIALAWGLALFACTQVGPSVFMDCGHPELRHPEYDYRYHLLRQRLAEEPDRLLLLVLGSSRAGLSFRPEVLPDYRTAEGATALVFNFALFSSGPVQELVYLDRLLDAGIRPRWVFIEVLPGVMDVEKTVRDEYYQPDRLGWRDLPVLSVYRPRPWQLYQGRAQKRLVPWSAYRFPFLSYYALGWLPRESRMDYLRDNQDRSGWLPWSQQVTPEQYQQGLNVARQQYGPVMEHFRLGDVPDHAVRAMVDRCRQESIPVALFVMPEGSDFRNWYSPATLDAYLSKLRRECEVPVIDAREWAEDRAFMDGHHLLPNGAAAFTKCFGEEAIRPLVEDRLPEPRRGRQ